MTTAMVTKPAAHHERTARFIVPLADALDERIAGGKASSLARLIGHGMPVPDGCVITLAALDAHLAAARLRAGRRDDDAAPRLRGVARTSPFPPEVDGALEDVARQWLMAAPLAVRSSAIGEDGRESSFAGQFDSVLGVDSRLALHAAVRTCWASLWSERALAYRRSRGIPAAGMAVVVQRQVAAAAAGVLFTRHPDAIDDDDDRMLAEYCAGLADRLVAGEIDPARVEISRRTRTIAKYDAADDDGDREAVGLVLSGITELANLAIRLETAMGGPQDIEWAIDRQGRLAIVQARPITAAARSATREVLWSNANVNENFPAPISPLLYSLASKGYYHYFRNLALAYGVSARRVAAIDRPLRGIIGVHGARLYYNLTNVHAVLRSAPFGDHLAAAFNQFVGAGEMAAPGDEASGWYPRGARVRHSLEVARMTAATAWQYLFLSRRLRQFERCADAFAARTTHEALAGASLAKLNAGLAALLDIRCHRWKNAGLCDAAAMVSFAALERLLAASGCDAAAHTRLLRALPGVPSSQPSLELWKLSRSIRTIPALDALFRSDASSTAVLEAVRSKATFARFRRELERYLTTWGFRSSCELMLTLPTLEEQPAPVVDLLRQYVRAEGDAPERLIERQAAERRRETRTVLGAMAQRAPARALLTWLVLRATQRAVAYRERARLKQALLYTRYRRLALVAGEALVARGQLARPEQVFMLTCEELDELTAGRAMFATGLGELVALREREHAALSALTPPDTLRLPEGTVYDGHHETTAAPGPAGEADATRLTGTSACGGYVSARASVLADVRQASRLRRGDILVTRQTDPGWAPIFGLISGLVIERGGMLSHGAIIAREFGLPCLVGVKEATRRIPDGAHLALDGNRGECVVGEVAS